MKKTKALLLCGLIAGSLSADAQFSITMKPNATVGQDAAVIIVTPAGCIPTGWGPIPAQQTASPNHPEMIVHANSIFAGGCTEAFVRSLIRFTEINSLPANATITYAELRLFGVSSSSSTNGNHAPNESWLTRLNDAPLWNENTVTWNSASAAYGFGINVSTPVATSPGATQLFVPASTSLWNYSVAMNVTNDVQHMYNVGAAGNNGWILELQKEIRTRYMLFASSDHTDSTLWPELYVEFDAPCDPDFTWSTNTAFPPLTYNFGAQNPGSGYQMTWTDNGIPFGTGGSASLNYSQQPMTSSNICLKMALPNGQPACNTCLKFCHGDFSPTNASGGCNSHFSVSGNTNAPNLIMLRANNPSQTSPSNYRWYIYVNGNPTPLGPYIGPITQVPVPTYANYYSVKLEIGSTCYRWQGNLCTYPNNPSPFRLAKHEERQAAPVEAPPLDVFPNPATDMVTVRFTQASADDVVLILTDVAGKTVYQSQQHVEAGSQTIKFSVAELPPSFYTVQVHSGGQTLRGKLVKQ